MLLAHFIDELVVVAQARRSAADRGEYRQAAGVVARN